MGSSSVQEPVTFTSDVEQRKQRSQNNRKNEHKREKTKKNFTGSYTEVNPNYGARRQQNGNGNFVQIERGFYT